MQRQPVRQAFADIGDSEKIRAYEFIYIVRTELPVAK